MQNSPSPSALSRVYPVSVVIVNFNAGELLIDAVTSCLTQANQVIVVDNGSKDQSLEELTKSVKSDRLQIILNTTNLGFAMACNQGAELANNDQLLFLNPDCQMSNGALGRMITNLQASKDIAMVGGLLLNPDGSEQGGGRRAIPTPWRSFVRAFGLSKLTKRWPKLFDDFYLHEQPLPDASIDVEAISGACILIKSSVFHELGGWDEGYFLHCEDLDLCLRSKRAGYRTLFVPDAPVIHYQGACSKPKPLFVEWHKHCGMIRFYKKFFLHQYPGPLWWLVTLGVWLRFALVVAKVMTKHLIKRFAKPEVTPVKSVSNP